MKKLNENTIIATGTEIAESGYFPHNQPNDSEVIMWINWTWSPTRKISHFAPVVEVFETKQPNSTHKITGEEVYFKLNEHERGFDLEYFIEKFVKIERL